MITECIEVLSITLITKYQIPQKVLKTLISVVRNLKWCEQTEVVFLEGGERAFNGPHFGVNAHHPHRLEVQIIGQ